MPEPTKTASAPSCIISAASAGVAIPPAEKFGTGSLPACATQRTRSYGAPRFLASVMSSSGDRTVSRRMPDTIARMCRTASTMLPEPASPLVRIMAAPSPMRRSASPRSRQPHTNGTRNANLSMWKCSSAGVSTSDSSMKSMPSASRICASTKWPMRALAMTGMVTAFWISWILRTGDMRATPPSFRMSDGTRSRAITDAAPASSAILACSALVTSMMTPPLSISARPMCLRSAILSPFVSAMTTPFIFAVGAPAQGSGTRRSAIERASLFDLPSERLRRAPALDGRALSTRARAPTSYQRRRHALDGMRARTLARGADHLAEPPYALVDLAGRHRRERQPQRALAAAVHPERRTRSVGHAALERARQQRARVEPRRQRHQQREAALGLGPRDLVRHAPLERAREGVAAPAILARDTRHVAIEQPPLAEPVHGRLQQRARVQVGQLLGGTQPLGQRRRRHQPAEPQPREQHLRERADVDHDAVAIERLERRRGPLTVIEAAVEAVLDHRHLMARRRRQQPQGDVAPDREPGRVVRAGLAIEELGRLALEQPLERVHARAAGVAVDRQQRGAERTKHLHRPRVGRLLDGDRIAGVEQRPRDEIEALLRAVHDQDVFGARLEPEPQQVRGQVLSQRRIAADRVVLQQRLAFLAHDLVERAAKRVGREQPAVGHAAGERDHAVARRARRGRPGPLAGALPRARAARQARRPGQRLRRRLRPHP